MPDIPTPDDIAAGVPEDPGQGYSNRIEVGGFETKLITMDPEEARGWVERFPEHGNEEAASKLTDIISYGPDYASRGNATRSEELEALAKYWSLDSGEIRQNIEGWNVFSPEEMAKVDEFLAANAHLFGGGEPAAPEVPTPTPEVPPSPI